MTKPNDFILNTDYLALAQTSKEEFMAVFPSETFSGGQAHDRTVDFNIKATQGAIDRVLISRNNSDFVVGSKLFVSNSPTLWFSVYRTDPSTVRVRLHVYTASASGYTMPTQTLKIKVVSFRPPNLF